ncbi:MAG: hypothetical protein AAF518_17425 [Spirochaetota bacterium]
MNTIYYLAEGNVETLSSMFQSWRSSSDFSPEFEKFEEFLGSGLSVSLNMKLDSLYKFLLEGEYKNIYELYAGDYDTLEKNDPLFFYRFSFDTSFENGTSFQYGAVNAGNLGTVFWGDFCVYLEIPKDTVILKYNSLSVEPSGKYRYFDKDKDVNLGKLQMDLGFLQDAAQLVLLKNKKNQLIDISANYYKELVCDGEDYVEVIIEPKINLSDIRKVWFNPEIYEEETRKQFESEDDQQDSIVAVIEEMEKNRIPWEIYQ